MFDVSVVSALESILLLGGFTSLLFVFVVLILIVICDLLRRVWVTLGCLWCLSVIVFVFVCLLFCWWCFFDVCCVNSVVCFYSFYLWVGCSVVFAVMGYVFGCSGLCVVNVFDLCCLLLGYVWVLLAVVFC